MPRVNGLTEVATMQTNPGIQIEAYPLGDYLPEELTRVVFRHLPEYELRNAMMVSSVWEDFLSTSEELWTGPSPKRWWKTMRPLTFYNPFDWLPLLDFKLFHVTPEELVPLSLYSKMYAEEPLHLTCKMILFHLYIFLMPLFLNATIHLISNEYHPYWIAFTVVGFFSVVFLTITSMPDAWGISSATLASLQYKSLKKICIFTTILFILSIQTDFIDLFIITWWALSYHSLTFFDARNAADMITPMTTDITTTEGLVRLPRLVGLIGCILILLQHPVACFLLITPQVLVCYANTPWNKTQMRPFFLTFVLLAHSIIFWILKVIVTFKAGVQLVTKENLVWITIYAPIMAVVLILTSHLLDSKAYQEVVGHKTLKVPFRLIFVLCPILAPIIFLVRIIVQFSVYLM